MMTSQQLHAWLVTQCPAQYILNIDGQLSIREDLVNYMRAYIDQVFGGEASPDNLDSAVKAFELDIPVEPRRARKAKSGEIGTKLVEDEQPKDVRCAQCNIPLREAQVKLCQSFKRPMRCDVCATMASALYGKRGLTAAQAEWEHENALRVQVKQRIMRG